MVGQGMFSIDQPGIRVGQNSSILVATDSVFSVRYPLLNSSSFVGKMTVTYNFQYDSVNMVPLKPKITVDFAGQGSVAWLIVPTDSFVRGTSAQSGTNPIGQDVRFSVGSNNTGLVQNQVPDPTLREIPDISTQKGILVGPTDDPRVWDQMRPAGVLYIDWSDSGASASVRAGTLSGFPVSTGYGVEVVFPAGMAHIDPVLATSSTNLMTPSSFQRKTFFADGVYWAFFMYNQKVAYTSSVNGSVWNPPTTTGISLVNSGYAGVTASSGSSMAVYNNGSSMVYLAVGDNGPNASYYRGILLNNGSIIFGAPTVMQSTTTSYQLSDPSISVDSQGNIWTTFFMNGDSLPAYYMIYENGQLSDQLPATEATGAAIGNDQQSQAYSDAFPYCIAEPFYAPQTGALNSFFAYIFANNIGTFNFGIYNSTGNLIGNFTSSITQNVNQWQGLDFVWSPSNGDPVLVAGQKYYLAAMDNYKGTAAQETYYASSNTAGVAGAALVNFCGSALPATLNLGASKVNYQFDIYAGLTTMTVPQSQAPIVTPLSQNVSEFIYGENNTLVGLTYNSTGKATTTMPYIIQKATGSNGGGSATSVSCTFGSSVTAGDEILVAAGIISGNGVVITTQTPTDSLSDSFSAVNSIGTPYQSHTAYAAEWIAKTTSGGSNTISLSYNSGPSMLACYELRAGSTSGIMSSTGMESGSTLYTSTNVVSYAPAHNSLVIAVAGIFQGGTIAAGSGYTLDYTDWGDNGAEHMNLTSGSTTSPISMSSGTEVYAEVSAGISGTVGGNYSSPWVIAQNVTEDGSIASAVSYAGRIHLTFLQQSGTSYKVVYDEIGTRSTTTTTTTNNDTFSGPSLDGWTYFGASGYSLTTSSTVGDPVPSAYVSGDTVCCPVTLDGMQKSVSWSGYGSFVLSLNFRANSSYTGSTTTNAYLNVSDSITGAVLYHYTLFAGGGDTGWRSFSQNISSYVQGHANVKIQLYLNDGWSTNYHEQNWYDNVAYTITSKQTTAYVMSSAVIEQNIAYPVRPAITINNATGDIYIFWAGYPVPNQVYYDFYNATSETWSPVVHWLNATDIASTGGGLTSSYTPQSGAYETITTSPYAHDSKIGLMYEVGYSSPYSVMYSILDDPPSVLQTNVYNAIQAGQDYLTRLQRNSMPSAQIPAHTLSEYPSIPIMVRYSDGCYVPVQNGGAAVNGGIASGCSLSATQVTPTITVNNSLGTTSENYTYYFTSPWDTSNVCNAKGGSPNLQVVVSWYGYEGYGPVFQYTVNMKVLGFDDASSGCSAMIFLGNQTVATGVSNTTAAGAPTYSWTGTVHTYPKGGGGVNWGFDFNPLSGPGVTPTPEIDSFRYTTRSALQSEWKYALSTDQPDCISYACSTTPVWKDVQNELYSATQPFTVQDVYTPQWFYGQSQQWNFEDNSNTNGGVYTDCSTSNQPGNLPNGLTGLGWEYPYQSKVCNWGGLGVSAYLSVVWAHDPLVMGETAIQVLNTYGPNDAAIPWNGSTDSPVTFASSIVNGPWYNSTYGIVYPHWDAVNCPNLCPQAGVFSGDRTPVIAELLTLLAYKYGYTQFKSAADNLVNILVWTQWGMDNSPANGGCQTGCGLIDNGGSPTYLFRPENIGGQILGWNADWQFINPQSGSILDLYNMPQEYGGVLPTDQEATQATLAALLAYYNLAVDTGSSWSSWNNGVQPFDNYIFQGTSETFVHRSASLNDAFPSGQYILHVTATNEGDGYSRFLQVLVNGESMGYYTIDNGNGNASSAPSADSVHIFNVPLPGTTMSTSSLDVAVRLTTSNYTSPSDWWVVSADIEPYIYPTVIPQSTLQVTADTANPQTGTSPLNVTFSVTVAAGTAPYTYTWSFGDGNSTTVQSSSATNTVWHIYTSSGVYSAGIEVTDSAGHITDAFGTWSQINVVQGSNVTCTPPPVYETFWFLSFNGISGSSGGGNATTENQSCQPASGVLYFVAHNGAGQTVGIATASLGQVSVNQVQTTSRYFTGLGTGSYTVEMFVLTPDGVSVSPAVSSPFTVS